MKTKVTHTPEPWALWLVNKTLAIGDGHGWEHTNDVVAWPGFDSGDKPWKEKIANARRIVACVNACEGLETEKLELVDGVARAVVKELGDVHALKMQRDTLATALREFGKHDPSCEYLTNDPETHPGCDCGFAQALVAARTLPTTEQGQMKTEGL